MKLFVYGTLRRGASNPCENYGGKYVCTTTLSGAVLYDLGWYPGLKFTGDDEDKVIGDVYEVDQSIITQLDRYEGYRPDSPQSSLYIRKKTSTFAFDVFVYEYNGFPDNSRKVEGGDWLNYVT